MSLKTARYKHALTSAVVTDPEWLRESLFADDIGPGKTLPSDARLKVLEMTSETAVMIETGRQNSFAPNLCHTDF